MFIFSILPPSLSPRVNKMCSRINCVAVVHVAGGDSRVYTGDDQGRIAAWARQTPGVSKIFERSLVFVDFLSCFCIVTSHIRMLKLRGVSGCGACSSVVCLWNGKIVGASGALPSRTLFRRAVLRQISFASYDVKAVCVRQFETISRRMNVRNILLYLTLFFRTCFGLADGCSHVTASRESAKCSVLAGVRGHQRQPAKKAHTYTVILLPIFYNQSTIAYCVTREQHTWDVQK